MMTSIWQPISRASCLNTRTILSSCYKVDSLAARLAQKQLRSLSECTLQQSRSNPRWREPGGGGTRAHANINARIGIRTFASKRILTKYQELPPDFDPDEGLDFRAGALKAVEVRTIFGHDVDPHTANLLMRLVHAQRVAGTIDDPNPKKPTSVYQADVIAKALRWLRKNVPVNEIQNAGLRAEEELAAMEESILKDSERIGLYKPNSGKSWGNKGETSVLVELKKAKEQERLEEEAREKTQAEEIRENSGTLQTTQTPPASRVVLRNTNPEENALYKKYIESANILPDGIPQMSTFQRLWPAALMLLATFGACYLFTQIYVPPKLEARVFPDMPPSAATIITIIGLNAMVLVAWRFPPFYRFFNTYFITISARPNALSLLGNVFSHQTVGHFAINMSILWFVGTRLHDDIGRANFLALYLCAGVFGSFASLAWSVSRKIFITSSLGASGAICATIAAYLTLDSGAKMQFFGFPPDDWPSITCLGFLCLNIGLELLAWRRSTRTGKQGFDHVAHLGGYAAGIGYVQLMKRRAKERRRAEEERKGKMGWVERVKEGVTDVTSRKG